MNRLVVLIAGLAAFFFLVYPFWPWVVVGLWISGLVAPLMRLFGGRRRAAAVIMLGFALAIVGIIALVLAPLTIEAFGLIGRLVETGDPRGMLAGIVSDSMPPKVETVARLLDGGGARALDVIRSVAGATTHALLGLVVLVVVAYGRLANGAAAYGFIAEPAPIAQRHVDRLRRAFDETGRGLFVGIGGAGFVQALVSAVLYFALGVPHAILRAVLTLFSAVVPALGAALVWGPVASALFLTGHRGSALLVAAIGFGVISTVDNIVKPWLTRRGRLELPGAVIFVSILGGMAVAGTAGMLLGPLVVRLAKEAALIARDISPRTPHARHAHERASCGPSGAFPHEWGQNAGVHSAVGTDEPHD